MLFELLYKYIDKFLKATLGEATWSASKKVQFKASLQGPGRSGMRCIW